MNNEPIMPGHEYDGIRELDNLLPRWWVWLFALTSVFAAVYLVVYHVARKGDLQIAQYEKEMAAAGAAVPAAEPAAAPAAPAATGTPDGAAAEPVPSTDPAVLAQGKQLFLANCLACHGPDGGGLIGPNLCDTYWIHGPRFADSVHTIMEGVPAKGMITWKLILKPDQIQAVASYIYTLRGTKPATPKAPEGEPEPGTAPPV